VCDFLYGLQALFNTIELLKLEFSPKALKGYIGTLFAYASAHIYFFYALCLIQIFTYLIFWCKDGVEC